MDTTVQLLILERYGLNHVVEVTLRAMYGPRMLQKSAKPFFILKNWNRFFGGYWAKKATTPKYFKNPSRTSISCSVDMCVVNLVEIERVVFSARCLETYRQAFSKKHFFKLKGPKTHISTKISTCLLSLYSFYSLSLFYHYSLLSLYCEKVKRRRTILNCVPLKPNNSIETE